MKRFMSLVIVLVVMMLAVPALAAYGEDPCVKCHKDVTSDIVKQYEGGKHKAVGVKCYVCHKARKDDASVQEHNGFKITPKPSAKHCESCHDAEVRKYSSKKAWASFSGKAHATR